MKTDFIVEHKFGMVFWLMQSVINGNRFSKEVRIILSPLYPVVTTVKWTAYTCAPY